MQGRAPSDRGSQNAPAGTPQEPSDSATMAPFARSSVRPTARPTQAAAGVSQGLHATQPGPTQGHPGTTRAILPHIPRTIRLPRRPVTPLHIWRTGRLPASSLHLPGASQGLHKDIHGQPDLAAHPPHNQGPTQASHALAQARPTPAQAVTVSSSPSTSLRPGSPASRRGSGEPRVRRCSGPDPRASPVGL